MQSDKLTTAGSASRAELARRIAVTLGFLLLYRVGCYIPIPGIDPEFWTQLYATGSNSALSSANALSGGAIAHLSIFALGITPYVAAAVLVQVLMVLFGGLRDVSRRGEAGRLSLRRITLIVAIGLALLQGVGVANALQAVGRLVANPGLSFVATTALTFGGGMLVLVWLTEQITRHGLGNGIALVLLTGIVLELPTAVAGALQMNTLGVIPLEILVLLAAVLIILIGVAVLVESGRLVVPLRFAARSAGGRELPETDGALRLKLNNAGILPAVIAPWFFYVPLTFATFVVGPDQPWLRDTVQALQVGRPGHMVFIAIVTLVLTFVYSASVIDPDHIAERLQLYRGIIPGVASGEETADRIDQMASRATAIGAIYLVLIYLVPELLAASIKVPFNLGGASALVAVGVVLDIDAQVRNRIRKVGANII